MEISSQLFYHKIVIFSLNLGHLEINYKISMKAGVFCSYFGGIKISDVKFVSVSYMFHISCPP